MNCRIKTWFTVAIVSMVAFLCVFWLPSLKNAAITSWGEMMWLFATTYCLFVRYEGKISYGAILSAALAGALVLPCIVYALMWSSSYKSLIFTISMAVGIVLAALCHYKKSAPVFLLAVAFMVLFNTFAVTAWEAAV